MIFRICPTRFEDQGKEGRTLRSVICLSRGSGVDSGTGSSALRKGVVEKEITRGDCRRRGLARASFDVAIIRCRSIFSLSSSEICVAAVKLWKNQSRSPWQRSPEINSRSMYGTLGHAP
jgi:hypothetical protein